MFFLYSLMKSIMRVCMFFRYILVLHLLLTGVPDCREEDLSLARALNLRCTTVLTSDEDGKQTLINSDEVCTVPLLP